MWIKYLGIFIDDLLITYQSGAPQGFKLLHVGDDEIDGREVIHTHDGENDQVSDIDRSHLTETGKLKTQYTKNQCNEAHLNSLKV